MPKALQIPVLAVVYYTMKSLVCQVEFVPFKKNETTAEKSKKTIYKKSRLCYNILVYIFMFMAV